MRNLLRLWEWVSYVRCGQSENELILLQAAVGQGGASDPSKLWDLLAEGRDGFAEFKPKRLNLDGFYHPDQHRPGSLYTRGGYFLQGNPKDFDHPFFGITPVEAVTMDPAQRKLLEITYEAFENAGET